jgi:long-chain acyl-CoA synthetase
MLVVDDDAMLARVPPGLLDRLQLAVVIDGAEGHGRANVKTLTGILSASHDRPPTVPAAPTEQSPAWVAFSSGSTGRPSPIVFTHAQVLLACRSILATYPEVAPGARLMCWLPLANLFQRVVNLCGMMNGAISYIVSDPRDVMDVMPLARPDVLIAVPRFCEKVHAGIMENLSRRPVVARLVEWAMTNAASTGRSRPIRVGRFRRWLANLVDRALVRRIRQAFGGNLRFIVSGSAPMPRWLLERFEGLGIPVLEAYGVSENIVPIAANGLACRKSGSVGKPVGDNVVRIAADGEIQVRGQGVFQPVLQDHGGREGALTADGFLATGDVGHVDPDGFLVLEGRRAEVFKNSQGRWVSLPAIEAALRRVPGIDHAAVLRIDHDRLVGVLALPAVQALDAAKAERLLGSSLQDALQRTAGELPRAMQPCAYIVVSGGFSPATQEVTTNLKLRRAAIAARLAEPLEAIRAGPIPSWSGNGAPVPLIYT